MLLAFHLENPNGLAEITESTPCFISDIEEGLLTTDNADDEALVLLQMLDIAPIITLSEN